GDFNSTGANIALAAQSLMTVQANNVSLGNIQGGAALAVNANHTLNVMGNINMPQAAIVLNGDLAAEGSAVYLQSGTSITGASIAVTSGKGSLTSGSNLSALEGSISMNSGGALTILNNSQIAAAKDVILGSLGSLTVGSGSSSSNIGISA